MRVLIIGAGLIGTSFALALRQNQPEVQIYFTDLDEARANLAKDLVSGYNPTDLAGAGPDLVVIATPVGSILKSLLDAYSLYPQANFIDIGGLKSELLSEIESFPGLAKRFLATHPMAGREINGPSAARADLFLGRTWILTPTSLTDAQLTAEIYALVRGFGAIPVGLDPQTHDRAIAQVSHLPQVLSSLLSANLLSAAEADLHLAGQGLRDVSRLGESSASLWSELVLLNKRHLIPLLRNISNDLSTFIAALENGDEVSLLTIFQQGNEGRAKLPGKHGGVARAYSLLPIVIDDRPGQLSKIIDHCSVVGVNIEDISIEHSPGQLTGLVTLSLSAGDARKLQEHLLNSDEEWRVHNPVHPGIVEN